MPGKVNPTQCEAVTVCVKVIGNLINYLVGSHDFELNVFKLLIHILQSLKYYLIAQKVLILYIWIKSRQKRIKIWLMFFNVSNYYPKLDMTMHLGSQKML